MITTCGIEVNPNQIIAIQQLHLPNNPKEVQQLIGMIVALNRFVSRLMDRCRPFYQLLKKWKGFQWTEECDSAFKDLKSYLANPPNLSRPESEEDLYMYLAVSDHAISLVLIRQHEMAQRPMYYLNKTLVDAETRYLPLEKMVLALVHAIRKLPHHFQGHTIWVLTEYPLQSLLKGSDYTGRIAKLGMFNVHYKPKNSIKGQCLQTLWLSLPLIPRVS